MNHMQTIPSDHGFLSCSDKTLKNLLAKHFILYYVESLKVIILRYSSANI